MRTISAASSPISSMHRLAAVFPIHLSFFVVKRVDEGPGGASAVVGYPQACPLMDSHEAVQRLGLWDDRGSR